MNTNALDGVFASLSSEWETALSESRSHDVIVGGVLGYLFFHGKGDSTYENASLACVRKAIDDVLTVALPENQPSRAQHVCSFCHRKPPDVRLAAGASSFICDNCVSKLGELFREQ
jgi:ClpX C4-type zinc finger